MVMVVNFQRSKHTTWFLVCSILLFLSLDTTMLALNYKITHEVSEDAVIINLAGRQRMLSQNMAKSVFQIDPTSTNTKQSQTLILQYMQSYEMFTDTLEGFAKGGYVVDAEKKLVMVRPIDLPKVSELINNANQLLIPLEQLNLTILKHGLNTKLLGDIKHTLANINLPLLGLMNDITVLVEKNSQEKSDTLRSIQMFTFFLALLNFAFIVTQFRSGQRQSDQTINVLNELIQSAKASLVIFNEMGQVSMANESARRMFGYTEQEILQLSKDKLFNYDNEQLVALSRSGKQIPIELHERSIIRHGETLTIATLIESQQQINQNRALFQLANRDSLTGMFNRNALNIALYHKVQQTKFWGARFACYAINIDNFKQVNALYGRNVGDDVLKEFTYRLCRTTRDSDFIYRYGGDEFVLVVDLSDNELALNKVTNKINDITTSSFKLPDDIEITLTTSFGIAICPDDADDPEELLSIAQELMKNGKDSQVIELSQASKIRHIQPHSE